VTVAHDAGLVLRKLSRHGRNELSHHGDSLVPRQSDRLKFIGAFAYLEGAFAGTRPSGLIRVDVHGTQARYFLLLGLPHFRRQYPDIRLHLSEAHQPLDLIREGFDCILRAGDPSDSPLIKRRLATLDRGTFASPDSSPISARRECPTISKATEGWFALARHQLDHAACLPRRREGPSGDVPSTVMVTGPRPMSPPPAWALG
jgi:DNA-binding transcriptional LysR family regulator